MDDIPPIVGHYMLLCVRPHQREGVMSVDVERMMTNDDDAPNLFYSPQNFW